MSGVQFLYFSYYSSSFVLQAYIARHVHTYVNKSFVAFRDTSFSPATQELVSLRVFFGISDSFPTHTKFN